MNMEWALNSVTGVLTEEGRDTEKTQRRRRQRLEGCVYKPRNSQRPPTLRSRERGVRWSASEPSGEPALLISDLIRLISTLISDSASRNQRECTSIASSHLLRHL